MLDAAASHDPDADAPIRAIVCVPRRRTDTLSARCAYSSSPTSSRTRARRSGGAGCATRSRRCAGAGVEVELLQLPARRAASTSRRRGGCGGCCGDERFDLVHAHYGLPGWCARCWPGPDPLVVSFHGTDVRHPSSARSRAASPAASTSSPPSRAPCSRAEDGRPGLPARARLRGAALRPGPQPLRPAAARRGAARARARPRRPLPALPRQPGPAGEARRPRRASWPPPAAPSCSPAARSSPSRCRSGSTPPTPSSSPPTTRASAWSASRRSPARCRSSRPRSGSPPSSSPASRAPLRPLRRRQPGRAAARPTSTPADPRVAGAARAAALSAARMAERTIEAYRDVLDLAR